MSEWKKHVEQWRNCQACPLAEQRGRICLARGDVPCDVLFVGEAPGASEDALGRPFVGPAGDLLEDIIRAAIGDLALCSTCGAVRYTDGDDWTCSSGHRRRDGHGGRTVYRAMTNLVCCFPRAAKSRGDNEPESSEIRACEPRLIEFVNIAQPRLIVCVGVLAERWIDHGDTIKCADIVHPAAILRQNLPLAQRQNKVQHAAVVLRNAVVAALAERQVPYKVWKNGGHARVERRVYADHELPF